MSDISSQTNHSLQDLKGLSVGEILLRTRTHYGHSLEQVESVLRIRAGLLEALEQDDISKLPGRVYAIGFIRSYAEYLGLDGDQIVNLFKQQLGKNALRPEYNFPVAADESKRPDLTVFVISLIGLAIVFGCYTLFKPDPERKVTQTKVERSAEPTIETAQTDSVWPPKVEDVMPELVDAAVDVENLKATEEADSEASSGTQEMEPVESEDAVGQDTGQENSAPSENNTEPKVTHNDAGKAIRIFAKDPTWMQIKNAEGETVFTGILKRGKDIVVPENAMGWRMDTGNAGGIDIFIGEEKLPPLGENRIVVRRVPLFAEALRDRLD